MQTELRFLGFTAGLYVCFIYWGYLQEKLTSTKYQVASPSASGEKELEWNYPFALNFFMALAASTAAAIVETIADSSTTEKKAHIPFITYCRAALSSSLASPIGYAALKYISFPLMVLTKSSKPVPVMFIGVIFYQKRYTWYKVVSVFMLCTGIAMFSSAKKGGHGHGKSSGSDSPIEGEHSETIKLLIGIVLVSLNLLLDGYTNNEQDQIFEKNGATSYQMMKNVNLWQTIYILGYLVVGYVFLQGNSELVKAHNAFTKCPELRYDIMLFCLCASMGQVLIFAVMKEFGSLVWITISITRKLFTILFSVFMFNHPVNSFQWLGIASVFGGMTLEVYMSYATKSKSKSTHGSAETTTATTPAATRRSKRLSTAAADGDKEENGTKTPLRRRKSVSKAVKEEEAAGDGLISVTVPATVPAAATPSARKGRGKAKAAATPAADTPVSISPTPNGESTVKKRGKSKAGVAN